MKMWQVLADRTAVLFLGVAAGVAIGFAFAGDRDAAPDVPPLVPQTVAPPPPSGAAGADPDGATAND